MILGTIGLLIALALGILGAPLASDAQQPTKVPRVGVLWPISADPVLEGCRQGLRSLGYVEGQNIVIEYRYAQGPDDLLPDLAAELVWRNVDVILTWGVGRRPRCHESDHDDSHCQRLHA